MNKKTEPTRKEHFISEFYLKKFGCDENRIYQLDTNSFVLQKDPASIKEICCKKDLYEFKNEQGEIIAQNLIEKKLKLFEDEAGIVFKSVAAKAKCKSNLNTLSFLSRREKRCLIAFMALLRLRDPVILNIVQKEIKEGMGDILSDYELKNEALRMCLPIYKQYDEEEYKMLLYVLKWFVGLSFTVYYSAENCFITSDNPVMIFGNVILPDVNIDYIFFPMTPNVFLLMKPMDKTEKNMKNRLVEADKIDVDFFNACVVRKCHRWIYSKDQFSGKKIDFYKNDKNLYDEYCDKNKYGGLDNRDNLRKIFEL